MVDPFFQNFTDGFYWNDDLGFGHHGMEPITYTKSYFENYVERDKTRMGRSLTMARAAMVSSVDVEKDICVDVGIGGGAFVNATGFNGFDICKDAVKFLKRSDRFVNPFDQEVDVASFWDSLEHIPDPREVLRNVRKDCLVSMPIYRSEQHCLSSKHFKPGEHIWYFTHNGLIDFMREQGFDLVYSTNIESRLGREDITSYHFVRFPYG